MAGRDKRGGAKQQARVVWTPPALAPIDRCSWSIVGLAILGGLLIYARAMSFPLVEWDDTGYLSINTDLNSFSWSEVKNQFSSYAMGNYHPITMLSLAVDFRVAGTDTHWYHQVNIAFHLLNGLLVFLFLQRLIGDPLKAAIAMLLWCVHPQRVESVAWVSARKDVLLLCFGALSLIAYLSYLRNRKAWVFVLCLLFFVLACLSKATAVAFAPSLVLIDSLWKRDLRSPKVWLEKLPFFLIALAIGIVAIEAQASAAALGRAQLGLGGRCIAAASSTVIYFAQLTIPLGLNARYGWPMESGQLPWYYPMLAVILVSGIFIGRRKLQPDNWFGLLFFLVHLLPVLQIMSVGDAVRADRYTYVSSIGWALLIAGAITTVGARNGMFRYVSILITSSYALVLGVVAQQRTMVWKDPLSVWNDILVQNPRSFEFYMDRAISYARIDSVDKALVDFNTSVALRPKNDYMPLFNRGNFHLTQGRYNEALADYLKIFTAKVPTPGLLPKMVYAEMKLDLCDDVIRNATGLLAQTPGAADLLFYRSICYLKKGQIAQAAADVESSMHVRSDYGEIWCIRARVSLAQGDTVRACGEYERSKQWVLKDADFEDERKEAVRRWCATAGSAGR